MIRVLTDALEALMVDYGRGLGIFVFVTGILSALVFLVHVISYPISPEGSVVDR